MSGSIIRQRIFENKIVAILRGLSADAVSEVAAALYEGGVKCLEVTLNSPDALRAIARLTAQTGMSAGHQASSAHDTDSSPAHTGLLIGAGTVLDENDARAALDAGASFLISPGLDVDVIKLTKQRGAVSIPGAFTATEIITAWRAGADIIKVFPASVGPGYFKDLRGPLPHIPLMPTGGVGLDNIMAFHKAGAVAFGIGSALVDGKEIINDAYLRRLTEKARQFSGAIP